MAICRRDMREQYFGARCPDCGHAGILHPPMARGDQCEACVSLAALAPMMRDDGGSIVLDEAIGAVWQMRVAEGPARELRSKYQR